MAHTEVRIPAALLLARELTASAKVIWLALRLDDCLAPDLLQSPKRIAARTGFSQPTIRKAFDQLIAAGWYAVPPGKPVLARSNTAAQRSPAGTKVTIPGDLIIDDTIGVQTKLLYGILQVTPNFQHPTGQFTYAYLSEQLHLCSVSVKCAVQELTHAGWLQFTQAHQKAPVGFTLCNPGADRSAAEIAAAQRRLRKAAFKGEALMREFLSLIVASEDFEDDANPGFLVNPLTDERMQLDRFYPSTVAFEFNGPQHYAPTDQYSAEDVKKQRARDYMKLGICLTKEITLVVIHPDDLTYETMRQKVDGLLPHRNIQGHESLLNYLESIGHRYSRASRRGTKQRRPGDPPTP